LTQLKHHWQTALSLFDMLKDPLNRFPKFISSYVDLHVSGKRIQQYLNSDNVTPLPPLSRRAEEFASESSTPQDDTFELNGVFSWDSAGAKLCQSTVKWPRTKKKKQKKYNALAPADDAEASKDDDLDLNPEGGASQAEDPEGGASQAEGFRLRVSNLKIPAGSLVLVIGSVGSGKSSLLGALLSELTVLSGRGVNIKQMVAVSGLQVHQSTLIYTLTNCCLPLSALGS
jgi:ATPase subunit of ABC transporter with duplicated ATPase domains